MRALLLILSCLLVGYTSTDVGAQAQKPRDDVYLRAIQDGDRAWYAGQLTNYIRGVALVGVVDAQACERREVQFTYLSNAPLNGLPPTLSVRGQWSPPAAPRQDLQDMLREERLDSLRDQSCVALAPWRLGDNPGRQYLRARLVRDTAAFIPSEVAERSYALFTAMAHAPPAIIAGVAFLREPRSTDEEDKEPNGAVPIVGFDMPLVWGALPSDVQEVLGLIRPIIATGFDDPGEDLFVGVELQPAATGPRGAFNPLQFTLGYAFQKGDDSPFVAIHYNTTALLQTLLGLF